MSTEIQDPTAKSADLRMTLSADSGYSAEVEARISAQQWGDINHIVHGTLTKAASERDELLASANRLRARGFFNESSCADEATNADMAEMLATIARIEGGAL